MNMQKNVNMAYNDLVRWESWADDSGPDADQTLYAYHMMGVLSATQALMDQGVKLPTRWVVDQIATVNDMIRLSKMGA